MSTSLTRSSTNPLLSFDKRILLAVVGFVIAAVVGATALVGAAPADKPTKEWCAAQGYKNYGQCVSQWARARGYGGGGNTTITTNNTANTNVNVSQNGDNNFVDVALSYVFGS